ncbi:MAG: transporter substrate-binding domain-containing protein [Methylobacteriaceae bacterium]|nr:transporter substrate-binding domain-containing protein [Methylobacteriaceae bacterium]MBV9244410.1 transporter substrate-binding domain-containing protein [Methylobacteriaceae bacterium]
MFGASGAAALVGTALVGGAIASLPVAEARAQSSSATGKLQEVLTRGKLIVGTGTTNPPWHFEDETGQLVGMDIDMAHLFAKGLFDDPSKVDFVREAADARIPNLITNKIDIVCQFMTITPARARQVEFTIPYYREGIGLLLAKNSKYNTYADLKAAGKDARISWLQNPTVEPWTRKVFPDIQILQFDSVDASIEAILSGRADAAAEDQSTVRWLTRKSPDRLKDAGFGWIPNSYAFAVKPGDQVWLNFVNTMVKEAVLGLDFDDYQASFKKWFGVDLPIPRIGYPSEYGTI